MKSDTQSISIDASPEEVFGFLSNPANLPKWATGFCKDIRSEKGTINRKEDMRGRIGIKEKEEPIPVC